MITTDINTNTSEDTMDDGSYIQYLPIEAAFQAVSLIIIMLVAKPQIQ